MRQSGAESRCWGLESWCAYPGWGLLQLDPHMGLSILVHKLHQLLSIITPDQHHWPSQPQGLLQLQEGKCPQGLLCSDFFPWYLCFPPPSPLLKHPNIPGYLLSSSSILSDVKEDSTGSSLTCHPGLQRYTAEVPRGSAGLRERHSRGVVPWPHLLTHPPLPRTLRIPHLCTYIHNTCKESVGLGYPALS